MSHSCGSNDSKIDSCCLGYPRKSKRNLSVDLDQLGLEKISLCTNIPSTPHNLEMNPTEEEKGKDAEEEGERGAEGKIKR